MTLKDLAKNSAGYAEKGGMCNENRDASGIVKSVGGEKVLRHRLLEMGITPGTRITVKKTAPMGDPIEVLLRGYVLTLRLDDAAQIGICTDIEQHDCPHCEACPEAKK